MRDLEALQARYLTHRQQADWRPLSEPTCPPAARVNWSRVLFRLIVWFALPIAVSWFMAIWFFGRLVDAALSVQWPI